MQNYKQYVENNPNIYGINGWILFQFLLVAGVQLYKDNFNNFSAGAGWGFHNFNFVFAFLHFFC